VFIDEAVSGLFKLIFVAVMMIWTKMTLSYLETNSRIKKKKNSKNQQSSKDPGTIFQHGNLDFRGKNIGSRAVNQ
jgi:hypothetical protein